MSLRKNCTMYIEDFVNPQRLGNIRREITPINPNPFQERKKIWNCKSNAVETVGAIKGLFFLKSVKSVENCRHPPLCAQVKLLHKQKSHFRRENGFWNCQCRQIPRENSTQMKIFTNVMTQTFYSSTYMRSCYFFWAAFPWVFFLQSEFKRKPDWIFGKEFYFNNSEKHHFP